MSSRRAGQRRGSGRPGGRVARDARGKARRSSRRITARPRAASAGVKPVRAVEGLTLADGALSRCMRRLIRRPRERRGRAAEGDAPEAGARRAPSAVATLTHTCCDAPLSSLPGERLDNGVARHDVLAAMADGGVRRDEWRICEGSVALNDSLGATHSLSLKARPLGSSGRSRVPRS